MTLMQVRHSNKNVFLILFQYFVTLVFSSYKIMGTGFLQKVLLLTVAFAVDLGSGLRWVKATVPCL
jgi:hypothetical protein